MSLKEKTDMLIMWRTACIVNGFVNPDHLKAMRRREQNQELKKTGEQEVSQ